MNLLRRIFQWYVRAFALVFLRRDLAAEQRAKETVDLDELRQVQLETTDAAEKEPAPASEPDLVVPTPEDPDLRAPEMDFFAPRILGFGVHRPEVLESYLANDTNERGESEEQEDEHRKQEMAGYEYELDPDLTGDRSARPDPLHVNRQEIFDSYLGHQVSPETIASDPIDEFMSVFWRIPDRGDLQNGLFDLFVRRLGGSAREVKIRFDRLSPTQVEHLDREYKKCVLYFKWGDEGKHQWPSDEDIKTLKA